MTITIVRSDITEVSCDCIINPANCLGEMRGGLSDSIRVAGGDEIENEAKKAGLALGKATATTAGKLDAKYVIHTPTMEKPVEKADPENVRLATKAALETATKLGLKNIAFPALGTGTGKLHPHLAARLMNNEMRKFPDLDIRLVARNENMEESFKCELESEEFASSMSVVLHKGKVLLLQRSDKVCGFNGWYHGPAGHVDRGKTPDEISIQEIVEEAGIPKDQLKFIDGGKKFTLDKYGVTFNRYYYLYESSTDEFKLNWESSDGRWVDPKDVDNFKTMKEFKEALQAFNLL